VELLRRKRVFLIVCLGAVLTSCSTLVEKGGEALNGEAFKYKQLALYRGGSKGSYVEAELVKNKKDGEKGLLMSAEEYPGFVLNLSTPGVKNGVIFNSVKILTSSVYGWNEISLQLLGAALFSPSFDGETAVFSIETMPERVEIVSGELRYNENHLSGEESLTQLKKRRERILYLCQWMKDYEHKWPRREPPESAEEKRDEINYFADYWRPLSLKEGPKELLANNGLDRDWNEAAAWIYYEYNWETVLKKFYHINLYKVK
jgi:hypothetical protein